MLSVRDLRLTMLVTALSALVLCSQSQAAYTIGHAPARAGELCDYNATMVQTGSPGNAHLAPYDGVITSWSSRGFWAAPTFKVVRPGPSGTYTVLASDGPREYTGNGTTLETYPIRVPVRQGDTIAARIGAGHCAFADPGYSFGLDNVNRAVGETGGYHGIGSGERVPVAATLERDRDTDGYGDETQDACPTNAATQGACPLPTTLGQTIVPFSGAQSCGTSTRVVTDSPGVISAAAHDGVVTSWSYQASSIVEDGTIRVKMLRPQGASSYRVIGADEPRTPTPSILNTYPVRIPVRQGDRIGLGVTGSVPCSQFTAPGGYQQFSEDLPVGAEGLFFDSDGALDVSAVLEGDADGDGFGDTSQDQCPSDATTQGACAVDPGPNTACEKAREKLKKAKAKLKRLKQKDAGAKKVKKAKRKLTKAKAAVKKAC